MAISLSKHKSLGYEVEISTAYSEETIREIWCQIESETRAPYFRSWKWISGWIQSFNPNLIVVIAWLREKPVTIGLFTENLETRFKYVHSHKLRLHQTGNLNEDQIWVEYNGFLSLPDHELHAPNACLQTLLIQMKSIDEIYLSMLEKKYSDGIRSAFTDSRIVQTEPVFGLPLSNLENLDDYLATLTANTRAQIKRSRKLYEAKYGKLTFEPSENLKQALENFDRAGEIHVLRWSDSGFKNPHFVDFHHRLIEQNFDNNQVNLFKLKAGDTTLAILYFLLDGETAYFYLQGVNYEENGKFKPGLIAHTLAIEYFIGKGYLFYDFMGGKSQYKTQLSSHTTDLTTLLIQRPKTIFQLENMARNIKQKILEPGQKET